MAVTTVAQFAAELNRPAGTLLEQLQSAGVAKKSLDDALTESDKERLLEHLRRSHGTDSADRKKITLTKRTTSEIRQADASGKARTIPVQTKKTRTFIKRDDAPVGSNFEAPAPVDEVDLQRRENEANAQAEQLRHEEALMAAQARERAEREQADRAAAEAAAQAAAAAAAESKAADDAAAAREAAEAAANAAAAAAIGMASGPAKGAAAVPPVAAVAPVAAAPAAPVEAIKPGIRIVKAGDADAAEKAALAAVAKRRQAAENEAAAIRAMMNAPKKVMLAKKPEDAKPVPGKEAISGTIHKPKVVPGAPGAAAPGTAAKPGDKKSVKSEKLSSSWADDAAKKRAAASKGRTDGGGANRPGWRAPRGGRRGERDQVNSNFQAPTEMVIQDVHIPETISVADLAHKMSVKAAEVIKQLMKLGQMVTINQQLDQETAMIVVVVMGNKAFTA